MALNVIVGCCGYSYYRPGKDWKEKYDHKLQAYADEYPSVEINRTFYKLPRVSTAKKWRKLVEKVDKSFIFTMKANQRITHPPSSPTYKKANLDIPEEKESNFGFFRPTEEVFQAWKETEKLVQALDAEVCLFQCPPSFKPDKKNLENLENFYSQVEGVNIAFEPRGEAWSSDVIHGICKRQDLIHAVDPFQSKPAHIEDTLYFRLHGLGERKYKYKFSNKNLKDLLDICESWEGKKCFVMFNNYQAHQDAKRFLELMEKGELKEVSWKSEAVVETIDVDFPVTKEDILKKCGRWWSWVEPDKSIRVRQIVKHVKRKNFENKEQLLESLRKVYPKI
ncbi:MAG: DUF72 domain-containing protein [Thermoproteota archaeon]